MSVMPDNYQTMFDSALADLKLYYSPGAFEWLETKHPTFWRRVKESQSALVDAWKQPEKAHFREVLKRWYGILRKGFEEYRLNALGR